MMLISFDRSINWDLDPLRAAQGHMAGSESFDKATALQFSIYLPDYIVSI